MTREEIYDRLIALAERAIEWRYATASDAEHLTLGAENKPFPSAGTVRINVFTYDNGTYTSVQFGDSSTVSEFRGEVLTTNRIEAPYGERNLRLIERYLPEYERLIAEAIGK